VQIGGTSTPMATLSNLYRTSFAAALQ